VDSPLRPRLRLLPLVAGTATGAGPSVQAVSARARHARGRRAPVRPLPGAARGLVAPDRARRAALVSRRRGFTAAGAAAGRSVSCGHTGARSSGDRACLPMGRGPSLDVQPPDPATLQAPGWCRDRSRRDAG